MSKVISSVAELDFSLADLRDMPAPEKVMLVKPTYFDVEYVINPHMQGNIGDVNKNTASKEWEKLKQTYKDNGLYVHEVKGAEGYPDMVFCANQSLPYIKPDGTKQVLMSIMHAEQRKGEVPHIEDVYKDSSYEIFKLDKEKFTDFEGMGDAIWHFKKALIWGGYGFRSSKEVYHHISELFDVPVIKLELVTDTFYHLDTCFCALNEDTVLIHAPAFSEEGLKLIHKLVPNVIEANRYEAEELFACNAHCPDGKNVFIQEGCVDVNKKLEEAGFVVHQLSTKEFLKSGGSVFCMKMMLW